MSPLRIKKIEKSVEKVGWIPSRIVVNERYEVIDGQARLEVAKRHGFTIYVDVVSGIGAEACRAMNSSMSNWSTIDYIRSYASDGDINYVYLNNLLNQFGKFGFIPVLTALDITLLGGTARTMIKNGNFKCTTEDYEEACRKLRWVSPLVESIKLLSGRQENQYASLFFAYDLDTVNNAELAERFVKYRRDIAPSNTLLQALEEIEKIYNIRRAKRNYVFIKHPFEMQRMMEEAS